MLVRQDFSPEQISERMALENTLQISHETIYRHIYDDKCALGDLWEHLRCQKRTEKDMGAARSAGAHSKTESV